MELKIFAFGEDEGVVHYICATSKEEAVGVYKSYFGTDVFEEVSEAYASDDDWIREMDMNENFTYYHDGVNPEETTIRNHIANHCKKPDIFACSEF